MRALCARASGWSVIVVLLILVAPSGGGDATAGSSPTRWMVLPDSGLVSVSGIPAPSKTLSLEQQIDQCMSVDMALTDAPGASVAVLIDRELAYEQGYGRRRHDSPEKVNAETIFRIGSVTKQMTAAAVMQQVELGTVDLQAPVTDYIPELTIREPWSADDIKVWNLLTHTSGFPDRLLDLGSAGDDALSNWVTLQSFVPLHAPPGTFYNYSNPNFMLAGLVFERASGTPYRDYTQSRIWDPAGMTSTTYDVDTVVATGNYAWGHRRLPSRQWVVVTPGEVDSWVGGPAGFAFSTAADLVRWAQIFMEGGAPILSETSAAAMQAPHVWCHYGRDMYYGFGIMSDTYKNLDIKYHGGSVVGWGTQVLWVPERDFAVAVLANTPVPLSQAAACIVDAVLEPADVEPPDYSTPPDSWRPNRGAYDAVDVYLKRIDTRVTLEGEELLIHIGPGSQYLGATSTELVQIFPDTFYIDSDGNGTLDTDFTFIEGEDTPFPVEWLRHRYLVGRRPADRLHTGATRSR